MKATIRPARESPPGVSITGTPGGGELRPNSMVLVHSDPLRTSHGGRGKARLLHGVGLWCL